jgi:hypothetical protein
VETRVRLHGLLEWFVEDYEHKGRLVTEVCVCGYCFVLFFRSWDYFIMSLALLYIIISVFFTFSFFILSLFCLLHIPSSNTP